MADNVQSVTNEILRSIQSAMVDLRTEMVERFDRLDQRITRVEGILDKQRRDSAAMLVMMRATVGDFTEQVAEIEARLDVIEAGGRPVG
jgi:phage-related minor tail protein